jgi:hypothetical protein
MSRSSAFADVRSRRPRRVSWKSQTETNSALSGDQEYAHLHIKRPPSKTELAPDRATLWTCGARAEKMGVERHHAAAARAQRQIVLLLPYPVANLYFRRNDAHLCAKKRVRHRLFKADFVRRNEPMRALPDNAVSRRRGCWGSRSARDGMPCDRPAGKGPKVKRAMVAVTAARGSIRFERRPTIR